MVVKTTKLTAENRSAQYIIDKLTNELSVYKTTLVDINEKEKNPTRYSRTQTVMSNIC
jgi:hypothetical protein